MYFVENCSRRVVSISTTSHSLGFVLQALDEFVRKTFNEWTSTVDKEATRLLEIPLMRRSLDRSGTLDLNFDRLTSLTLFRLNLLVNHYLPCSYFSFIELSSKCLMKSIIGRS